MPEVVRSHDSRRLIYKLLQKVFLSEVGDEKVRERVYVPAESHETEMKEAQRAVDEITPLLVSSPRRR